jgi:hypothetical protein
MKTELMHYRNGSISNEAQQYDGAIDQATKTLIAV